MRPEAARPCAQGHPRQSHNLWVPQRQDCIATRIERRDWSRGCPSGSLRRRIRVVSTRAIKLSNTIFYCDRWDAAVDFYRRVLGLPVNVENDWFVEFRLTRDSFVSVADARRTSVRSSRGQGITLTLQVDDVHAERQRLAAAGVQVGAVAKHPWGALGFFCRDPEGYRLEFWQPLEP